MPKNCRKTLILSTSILLSSIVRRHRCSIQVLSAWEDVDENLGIWVRAWTCKNDAKPQPVSCRCRHPMPGIMKANRIYSILPHILQHEACYLLPYLSSLLPSSAGSVGHRITRAHRRTTPKRLQEDGEMLTQHVCDISVCFLRCVTDGLSCCPRFSDAVRKAK